MNVIVIKNLATNKEQVNIELKHYNYKYLYNRVYRNSLINYLCIKIIEIL